MTDKRRAERRTVDLGVTKIVNGESYPCRACEISPTGIRLCQNAGASHAEPLVELALPLVEGQLNTQVTARHVWSDDAFDAFEFVDASFAQQTILQRVFIN